MNNADETLEGGTTFVLAGLEMSVTTLKRVRAKCRALKMRPDDIDTIVGFLQRRKEGRRFNVRGSYKTFAFS